MTELRLSENALTVLKKRYLAKDENGKPVETPEQMFHRVARNIALMDLLFVPEAYTPEPASRGRIPRSEPMDLSVPPALEKAGATPQDLSTLRMAYERLLEEGHMKIGFGEVLALFSKYEKEIADLERRLYGLMVTKDFMFNSPTLMNAGRDLQQLSACFVLPVDDDLGMIFEALKQAALIHQSGGGTGFSFSRLRPKNDIVRSTGGVASGPVSFMKVFNAATEAVKQGGTRRGANMGILRVDHPDILEFITCKSNGSEITNFNISVAITDEFMKALEEDGEYELVNPRNKEVTGKLRAREVFRLICENAWRNGDPGVVFIDRINRDNPTPLAGSIESTNPCFAGETLIATDRGLERIDELYVRVRDGYCMVLTDDRAINQAIVVNGRSYAVPGSTFRKARVLYTGKKATVRVTLVNGQSIRVTPDHRLLTDRGWVRACDLTVEDFVYTQPGAFPDHKNGNRRLGHLLGWLTGDGWLSRTGQAGLCFSNADSGLIPYFQDVIQENSGGRPKPCIRPNGTHNLFFKRKALISYLEQLGTQRVRSAGKRVPKAMFTADKCTVAGFLEALYASDGTVAYADENHRTLRLSSASQLLLQDVQLLLANLGIFSRLYFRGKANQRCFTYTLLDGSKRTYRSGGYYELVICGDSLVRFAAEIGINLSPAKAQLLCDITRPSRKSTPYKARVAKVEPAGTCDVYDIQEPVTHSVVANGIVAHNCGEQPLLPHEACTLGSINLGNFVIRGDEPRVDYQRLEQVVHDSIHALDNVLEANKYPIPEIEKMVRANRKVGLGVMGWADMLLWLGIPYDSEEALALAREVASFINRTAVEASVALAESRGVFPNWKGSIFNRPGGPRRRNATVTTIAPTGTISILAGASTGIEPPFSLAFTRHVLDGAKLVEVNPIFEEVARSRGFYSEELIQKIARQGNLHGLEEVPEDIRRLFVTAHDISPEWHVRMQAAFQEYTENAVSKTINMPHEATVEDVARAYVLAYKLGCKGITVYRDRSRETQVLTTGAKTRAAGATAKEEPGVNNEGQEKQNRPISGDWGKIRPIPRPRRLYGITDVKVTPLGKLFLTLNLLDGHPVELFAQIGKAGSDVSAFTEAIARLISLALRSGIAPEEVADQLIGIGGARSVGFGPQRVRSVPDAIGQFISEFVNAEKEANRVSQGAPGVPVLPPQTRHEEEPGDTGFETQKEEEGKGARREEQPGATKKEPSITRASATSRQVAGGAVGAGCAEEKRVVTWTRLEGKSSAARGSEQQDETTKSMAERNAGSSSETAAAHADFDPSRSRNLFNLCPSCGIYAFAYVEGCSKCFACGYSEC